MPIGFQLCHCSLVQFPAMLVYLLLGSNIVLPAQALTITTPPQAQTVEQGQTATFAVAAEGTGALSYQWRKSGDPIPGAINPEFTIESVSNSDAAFYSVIVNDGT